MSYPAEVAAMIASIVLFATGGDVMIASAMRTRGGLGEIRARRGLGAAVRSVLTNVRLLIGVGSMAVSFFSLIFALNHAHLSLIAPASTSLTFVTNALAAKFFLRERVDSRRWTAAIFVCIGVALMAF
jgi:drug/metabolite transporter (DMT)-like permease